MSISLTDAAKESIIPATSARPAAMGCQRTPIMAIIGARIYMAPARASIVPAIFPISAPFIILMESAAAAIPPAIIRRPLPIVGKSAFPKSVTAAANIINAPERASKDVATIFKFLIPGSSIVFERIASTPRIPTKARPSPSSAFKGLPSCVLRTEMATLIPIKDRDKSPIDAAICNVKLLRVPTTAFNPMKITTTAAIEPASCPRNATTPPTSPNNA